MIEALTLLFSEEVMLSCSVCWVFAEEEKREWWKKVKIPLSLVRVCGVCCTEQRLLDGEQDCAPALWHWCVTRADRNTECRLRGSCIHLVWKTLLVWHFQRKLSYALLSFEIMCPIKFELRRAALMTGQRQWHCVVLTSTEASDGPGLAHFQSPQFFQLLFAECVCVCVCVFVWWKEGKEERRVECVECKELLVNRLFQRDRPSNKWVNRREPSRWRSLWSSDLFQPISSNFAPLFRSERWAALWAW